MVDVIERKRSARVLPGTAKHMGVCLAGGAQFLKPFGCIGTMYLPHPQSNRARLSQWDASE